MAFYVYAIALLTYALDQHVLRLFRVRAFPGWPNDPLVDGYLNSPLLAFFWLRGPLTAGPTVTLLLLDALQQIVRWRLSHRLPAGSLREAYGFTKSKSFIIVAMLVLCFVEAALPGEPATRSLPWMAISASVAAVLSISLRLIPSYWYANTISLLNLVSGIASIAALLLGAPHVYSVLGLLLGQFLDLFDGRAADRWGSTHHGEMFDDVADGTAFGGVMGLLMYKTMARPLLGVLGGTLHALASTYRLIRFVREKRAAQQTGGVTVFFGCPAPAAAMVLGCLMLMLPATPVYDWVRLGAVATMAALMASRIRYPHIGRTLFRSRFLPPWVQGAALGVSAIIGAQAIRVRDYTVPNAIGLILCLVFVACPLFVKV